MSSVVSGSGTWYEVDAARLQRCDDIVEEACCLRDVAEQRVGCSRDLVVRLHLVHLALQLGHLGRVRVRIRARVRARVGVRVRVRAGVRVRLRGAG